MKIVHFICQPSVGKRVRREKMIELLALKFPAHEYSKLESSLGNMIDDDVSLFFLSKYVSSHDSSRKKRAVDLPRTLLPPKKVYARI